MTRRIAITAGGTGGHIFPGLAVAEQFRSKGDDVLWFGSAGGMEERLVIPQHFDFCGLRFKGMRGKGIRHAWQGLADISGAVLDAVKRMKLFKPDILIAFGGYPTFPALLAARFLHIPIVLHESNRVLGLANRMALGWADRLAVSFPNTFVRANFLGKLVHTGAPLRAAFEQASSPIQRYLSRTGRLNMFVVGGSQGATALNRVVPAALALLSPEERPYVLHQAGMQHVEALKASYSDYKLHDDVRVVGFIDDMLAAYCEADIVLCRAGALTVAEALALGVPAAYVPLPMAKDQPANAAWCADQGVGWCLPQAELTAESLATWFRSLNREILSNIADRAYHQGVRDATARLVDVCEQVIEARKKKYAA